MTARIITGQKRLIGMERRGVGVPAREGWTSSIVYNSRDKGSASYFKVRLAAFSVNHEEEVWGKMKCLPIMDVLSEQRKEIRDVCRVNCEAKCGTIC